MAGVPWNKGKPHNPLKAGEVRGNRKILTAVAFTRPHGRGGWSYRVTWECLRCGNQGTRTYHAAAEFRSATHNSYCLKCAPTSPKRAQGVRMRWSKYDVASQREWVQEQLTSNARREDDCLLWTGPISYTGYGKIHCPKDLADALFPYRTTVKGMATGAHRLAYALSNGPIASDSVFVCHACDNKLCINTEHLWLGDAKANGQDASKKGRLCRGERQHDAKLSEERVRAMRMLSRRGMSTKQIAIAAGVTYLTAQRALAGETWAHVKGKPKQTNDDAVQLQLWDRREAIAFGLCAIAGRRPPRRLRGAIAPDPYGGFLLPQEKPALIDMSDYEELTVLAIRTLAEAREEPPFSMTVLRTGDVRVRYRARRREK